MMTAPEMEAPGAGVGAGNRAQRQKTTPADSAAPDLSRQAADTPDLDEADHFITLLAPPGSKGCISFQTFDDSQAKRQNLVRVLHAAPDAPAPALHALVRTNTDGAGVFVTVNATDSQGRTADNIVGVRALFVDFDEPDAERDFDAFGLAPSIIVESSPGKHHCYWLADGFPLAEFTAAQRRLIGAFGSDDKIHDLSRVMRLPGFVHRKGEPFRTRFVQSIGRRYSVDELRTWLATLPAPRAAGAPGAAPASAPADRYAESALQRALGAVVAAGEGTRNATLNRQAHGLYGLALAGRLAEATVTHKLTQAALAVGLGEPEIIATLASARRGASPRPADPPPVEALRGLDRLGELQAAAASQSPSPSPSPPPAEWPDPILPGQVPVPDIPADVLPTWLGDMAAAVANDTQTPPALAVMLALSALATVLQRRFEVQPKEGYTEPLSLWTLTALPSGTRKTAVLNHMTGPLVRWEKHERDRLRVDIARNISKRAVAKKRIERLLQDAAKAADEREREAIRADIQREEEDTPEELRAPRLFTGDCTAERLQQLLVEHAERMAVLSDEAGIFLIMCGVYSGGIASLDVFLQGHAGSAMRVDRAGHMAHLDKPALAMGLALQPGVLADVGGSRRLRDSGISARFLYAMPASTVGRRDVRRHAPVPASVRDAYERALFELMEGTPATATKPQVLPMSDPAREVWFDLADEIEREMGDGGRYESISDWASKLPGAAARVAALLELAEVGLTAECVSQVAMERAVRLARLLIPHAQAAFGLLGTDGVDTDAAAIVKWLQAGRLEQFSRRECQKAMEGRFRNIERLAKALDRLGQHNVVQEFKKHNRGAPPTVAYRVNPKVLST